MIDDCELQIMNANYELRIMNCNYASTSTRSTGYATQANA